MAVTATLCGMDNFAEIEDFCENQTDWLQRWIELPSGVPTAQTFSNIFNLIEPKQFNQCLQAHLKTISAPLHDGIIALDGKTLRGSHTLKQKPVHVVSAWDTKQQLTICQDQIPDRENEIAAIDRILDQLDLTGHTITIDAMGTQRAFARKIVHKKADYLFASKGTKDAFIRKQSTIFTLLCGSSSWQQLKVGVFIKTFRASMAAGHSAVS